MNVRRINERGIDSGAAKTRDSNESPRLKELLHSSMRRALSSVIAGSIAISAFAGAKPAFADSSVPQQYRGYTQVIADANTDVSGQLANDVNNLLGQTNGLYANLGGERVIINSAGSKPTTTVSNQSITSTEFNNLTSIIMNYIPVYFSASYLNSGGNIPVAVQNEEQTASVNANNIINSAGSSSYYQAEQQVTEAIYGSNLISSESAPTPSGSGGSSPTTATPPPTKSSNGTGTGSGTPPAAQGSSTGTKTTNSGSNISTSNSIAGITMNR